MAKEDKFRENSPEKGDDRSDLAPSVNSEEESTEEAKDLTKNHREEDQEDVKYRSTNLANGSSSDLPRNFRELLNEGREAENTLNEDELDKDTLYNGNSANENDKEEEEEMKEDKREHQMDEVDDTLLNDIERTLHHHGKSENHQLHIDMSKLKESGSKKGSHRTESVKSRHSSKSHESSERSKKSTSRKLQQFGTSENPLDITEMAVDCGSLLDLYQNDYFDSFMHMYHLYHKKEPGVHEYLVNMLYTKRTNEEILFYLPQLCQLSISKYGKSSLHRFLLDKASMSMHFALQLSWFYQAAIDDQIPKYDRLTQKMTQDTEMAVVNCKLITPNSFTKPTSEVSKTEKLLFPCLLDRRLLLESLSKRRNVRGGHLHEMTSVESLLTPQMPNSLVHNTFTLSSSGSKVKLVGVHTKLGNPLILETHPILDYTDDLHLELQKLMMKQRRLNYFNTLNNFVALCMQNASLLVTEAKREAREPLLTVFASALNEWMLLRRCTVAAYEESFAYTGLSLPFYFLNKTENASYTKLNGSKYVEKTHQKYAQMIRIVVKESKIFFSKKRAPFVFYVEMANLDEDIEYISQHSKEEKEFNIKDLYVFEAIVEELINYDLLTKSQVDSIKNPLEAIRFALDMLPSKSLERYNNIVEEKEKRDSMEKFRNKTPTPEESMTVSREMSSGPEENTEMDVDGEVEGEGLPENEVKLSENGNADENYVYDNDNENESTPNETEPGTPNSKDNNNNSNNNNNNKNNNNKDNKEGVETGKEAVKEKETKVLNVKNMKPEQVKNIVFTETFQQKKERIRRESPYGNMKSWDLCAFVVKGNDDLRQEKMANQVLESLLKIFMKAKLPLWLRPIEILVTGSNSGIMEFLHDTYSVDVIKRKFNSESLAPVFEKLFHENIYEARKNFIESHAAYSIVSYLLQVKDRHNGNILLDPEGHVIHIDYGFCLSNFPGKIISFETSPFKLTKEYLDVIEGGNADNFVYFKTLVIRGLLEARKYVDEIVLLVEMMTTANKMPCFMAGTTYTLEMFKERFMLNQSEETCVRKITEMIDASVNSFSTVQYDNFQRLTNGIL